MKCTCIIGLMLAHFVMLTSPTKNQNRVSKITIRRNRQRVCIIRYTLCNPNTKAQNLALKPIQLSDLSEQL